MHHAKFVMFLMVIHWVRVRCCWTVEDGGMGRDFGRMFLFSLCGERPGQKTGWGEGLGRGLGRARARFIPGVQGVYVLMVSGVLRLRVTGGEAG